MKCAITIYMNRRDVTGWLTRIYLRQVRDTPLFRQCELTFASWHEIEEDASWDVFGSYDPTKPRSEILLRGGIIPPDQRPQIGLQRGESVPVTVTLYDWAWRAQRVAPRSTLVVANSLSAGRRAVAEYGQPVGRYTTIVARHLSTAVAKLGALGGFWVDWRLPDYELGAMVLDPGQSLWESIRALCEPYAPEYYFRRDTDCLVVSDRLATEFGFGTTMTVGLKAVGRIEIVPTRLRRRFHRVIVRFLPWR